MKVMNETKPPREWWITVCGDAFGSREAALADHQDKRVRKVQPIPVIEKSAYDALLADANKLAEALDWAVDWICPHSRLENKGDTTRQWCCDCHNWVYPKERENKARAALAEFRAKHGGEK
jgi:hypothetical protein